MFSLNYWIIFWRALCWLRKMNIMRPLFFWSHYLLYIYLSNAFKCPCDWMLSFLLWLSKSSIENTLIIFLCFKTEEFTDLAYTYLYKLQPISTDMKRFAMVKRIALLCCSLRSSQWNCDQAIRCWVRKYCASTTYYRFFAII